MSNEVYGRLYELEAENAYLRWVVATISQQVPYQAWLPSGLPRVDDLSKFNTYFMSARNNDSISVKENNSSENQVSTSTNEAGAGDGADGEIAGGVDGKTAGETGEGERSTITLPGVPRGLSNREVLKRIPTGRILRSVYNTSNQYRSLVISLDSKVRERLLAQGPLVWMRSYHVSIRACTKLAVCGHCLIIGHTKLFCPNRHQSPNCSVCGVGGHDRDYCPNKIYEQRCYSCAKSELYKDQSSHSPFFSQCPSRLVYMTHGHDSFC